MSGRCYQNMAIAQNSHAQVLYINYYEKDRLLLQENKWDQDKSKDQYFLQTPSHVRVYPATISPCKSKGTTFHIFAYINYL